MATAKLSEQPKTNCASGSTKATLIRRKRGRTGINGVCALYNVHIQCNKQPHANTFRNNK